MKKIFKIITIVIGSILLLNIILIPFAMIGMKEIKQLSITTPDLSTLADNTYTSIYKKGRWNYNVSVEILDNKISDIKVKKAKIPTPEKVNNEIIKAIIKEQSLSLDAISGASVNTKALCKAVEIALRR